MQCEWGRIWKQVAQQGCRISFLGDIPKSPGHGPGQPALGDCD